jgi:hypothetical protein
MKIIDTSTKKIKTDFEEWLNDNGLAIQIFGYEDDYRAALFDTQSNTYIMDGLYIVETFRKYKTKDEAINALKNQCDGKSGMRQYIGKESGFRSLFIKNKYQYLPMAHFI